MPRGGHSGGRGKKNYKGQRRHFTDEDEIARQMQEEEKKKLSGKKESGDDEEGAAKGDDDSSSSSDSESSSDEDEKPKGVAHLIDIENPNRAKKQSKKVTALDVNSEAAKPQLSRREREELEKQQARARYNDLHAKGQTEEARVDLARLAIIRKKREEEAKRLEEEKKAAAAAKSKSKS